MNCHNHPDRNATAICVACGRGLCNECISSKPGLCRSCYDNSLRSKVTTAIYYLIILTVIGIVGYIWDPMGKEGMSQAGFSSYMLMATCTGIFLISGKIRIPVIAFLAAGANNVGIMMLLVMFAKLFIAIVLGSLLLPFIIIWQISVIALNISRIKKNR